MSLSLAAASLLLIAQVEFDAPTNPSPLQRPIDQEEPAASPTPGRFYDQPTEADPQPDANNGFDRSDTIGSDDDRGAVQPTAGEESRDGRYGGSAPAGGPATPPGGWSGSEGGFNPTRQTPANNSGEPTGGSDGDLKPVSNEKMELSKKLLAELVRIPAAEQSDGEKLTLLDALQRSSSRQATVDTYWRLVLATADYQSAMQDADRIAGWRPQAGRTDHDIDAAYEDALARRAEARADWLAARHDLLRSMSPTSGAKLPLTADLPHAGAYVLNFEQIFGSTGAAPRAAMRGKDVIPARHEGLRKRAEQLQAAEQRLAQFENAYTREQLGSAELLKGMEQLRAARSAFLRSVYIYNQEIAQYAFAVPGVASHETLTSILIKLAPQPDAARSVLQSAGSDPSENRATPATFVEPQPTPATPSPQPAPSLSPEPEPMTTPATTAPRLVPQPGFTTPTQPSAGLTPNYPPPRQDANAFGPTPAGPEPTLAEPEPTLAE